MTERASRALKGKACARRRSVTRVGESASASEYAEALPAEALPVHPRLRCARCAAHGVRYEPLAFTTQGGCETHAEAVLSQIAEAAARAEGRETGALKAEILETISLSIMRSMAKAVLRRRSKPRATASQRPTRFQAELATLEETED